MYITSFRTIITMKTQGIEALITQDKRTIWKSNVISLHAGNRCGFLSDAMQRAGRLEENVPLKYNKMLQDHKSNIKSGRVGKMRRASISFTRGDL